MMIPIRCFTCGNLIGDKWEEYDRRVKSSEDAGKVLDDLGLKRQCCRALFVGHVDLIKKITHFKV